MTICDELSRGGSVIVDIQRQMRGVVVRSEINRLVGRALTTRVGRPVLDRCAVRRDKTYTAMIRVRNEQEFLERAVLSIVDDVDHVLVIDNGSTDDTPQIIARLVSQYAGKIRSASYPCQLARYGAENVALWESDGGRRSPELLANFYNWCLRQCTTSFVLKWDGDTVATGVLSGVLRAFRNDPAQALWHTGANLHESRTHLIARHPFEDPEPRLFARRLARYDNGLWYAEQLRSPFVDVPSRYVARCDEPLYVHMKHCKTDRYTNMSIDLQRENDRLAERGQLASAEVRRAVARWDL